jgi:hypothetical protein
MYGGVVAMVGATHASPLRMAADIATRSARGDSLRECGSIRNSSGGKPEAASSRRAAGSNHVGTPPPLTEPQESTYPGHGPGDRDQAHGQQQHMKAM